MRLSVWTPLVTKTTLLSPPKQIPGYAPVGSNLFPPSISHMFNISRWTFTLSDGDFQCNVRLW